MNSKMIYVFLLFFILFSPNAYCQVEHVLNETEIWLGDDAAGRPKFWEADFEVVEDPSDLSNPKVTVEVRHVAYGDQPVYINGTQIGTLGINDPYVTFSFLIPAGVLITGTNTARIEATSHGGEYDDIALRNIIVSYEAAHHWINDQGGDWNHGSNWNYDYPPESTDNAVFNLDGTHIISDYNTQIVSLAITKGEVKFGDVGGVRLEATALLPKKSLVIDSATMYWAQGMLSILDGNIRGGGFLVVYGGGDVIGQHLDLDFTGVVEVNGNGSSMQLFSMIAGNNGGVGIFKIKNRGRANVDLISIGMANGGRGFLNVESGGVLEGEMIHINKGLAVIDQGNVFVNEIMVHSEGSIFGCNTGTVNVKAIENGGYVEPGCSIGKLTIVGDYIQEADGTLVIEVGGDKQEVGYDVLEITGNVTLDGTVQLDFINRFAPKKGDVFEFLKIDGTVIGSFSDVVIKGLEDGFEYDISIEGGVTKLTALNDGVSLNKFPWGMFFPAIIGDEK